jgi:hypothetical protein
MGLPLYVTCPFSFAAFSIISLFCILSVLISIYLGVFLFGFDSLMICKFHEPG